MESNDKTIEKVKDTLRRYFEYDDNGHPNDDYDERFYAQDALDAIHRIVGKI